MAGGCRRDAVSGVVQACDLAGAGQVEAVLKGLARMREKPSFPTVAPRRAGRRGLSGVGTVLCSFGARQEALRLLGRPWQQP